MEILTSRLQTLELNIINSKIECLNKEISLTLRKLYQFQIENSQKTLKKNNYKLNIHQSLVKLSRHINNNSSSHVFYLNKNISMSLKILKNKVYTELYYNMINKLNTLQRVIYYKKDLMYSKIRGTIVYRERKNKLRRKIGIILRRFSEKIIRNSEKCIDAIFRKNCSYKSLKDNVEFVGKPLNLQNKKIGNLFENSFLNSKWNKTSSEGVCTVDIYRPSEKYKPDEIYDVKSKYKKSLFDFELREIVCTVNKIEQQQDIKEGVCIVKKFVNIDNKKWSNFCCEVNKINYSNEIMNNKLTFWKDCASVVNKINYLNELSLLNNQDVLKNKENLILNTWKNKNVEVNQKKMQESMNYFYNFKISATDILKKNAYLMMESQDYNYKHIYNLQIIILDTLAKLNMKIIGKIYISLKNLYIEILKLRALLILKQMEYYIKGKMHSRNKKNMYQDQSKLSFILQKGDLESDRRFLYMINDTLSSIEKYKDPIIVRMGIQFILAKRYVEDIIYLKDK